MVRHTSVGALSRAGVCLGRPSAQAHCWPRGTRRGIRILSTLALITVLSGCGTEVDKKVKALRKGSAEERATAARTLAGMGEEAQKKAIPHLILMLKDPEPKAVEAAIHALAVLGRESEEVRDALVDVAGYPDERVEQSLINALMSVNAKEDLATLCGKLLKSNSPAVRRNAAMALTSIGSEAAGATGPLISTLNDTKDPSEDNLNARMYAAIALGNIGLTAPTAITALQEAASKRDDPHDPDGYVKDAAKEALRKLLH